MYLRVRNGWSGPLAALSLATASLVSAWALASPAYGQADMPDESSADSLTVPPEEGAPESDVYQAAFVRAGLTAPEPSSDLNLLASRLLKRAAPTGVEGADGAAAPPRALAQAEIEWEAERLGVYTPHLLQVLRPLPLDVPGPKAKARLADELAAQLKSSWVAEGYREAGFAFVQRGSDAYFLLIAAVRPVSVSGVPFTALKVGAEPVIMAVLAKGFASPELYITRPDGQVMRGPLVGMSVTRAAKKGAKAGAKPDAKADADAAGPINWAARIPLDVEGVFRVELLVAGAKGPTVGAIFNLYAGVPVPRAPVTKLTPQGWSARREAGGWLNGAPFEAPPTTDADLPVMLSDDDVIKHINALRRKKGALPLAVDTRLAKVAADQTREMARRGEVAHRFEPSRTLKQRLLEAGLPVERASENLAFHHTLTEAVGLLLASPAHRDALLDPRLTKIGMATFSAHGGVFIAQELAELAPKIDDAPTLARAVALRVRKLCPSVSVEDPGLSKLAQIHADAMQAGTRVAPEDAVRWLKLKGRSLMREGQGNAGVAVTAREADITGVETWPFDPRGSLNGQYTESICAGTRIGVGVERSDTLMREVRLEEGSGALRNLRVAPNGREPLVYRVSVVWGR
jgi:hypothetical protein